MSENTIAQNMAGRTSGEMVADLIMDAVGELDTDQARDAFWRTLRLIVPIEAQQTTAEKQADEMSDAHARMFGQTHLKFGKYVGERIDDVPLSYLLWLTEETDPFKRDLRRYIKSRRVQSEQDDGDEESPDG